MLSIDHQRSINGITVYRDFQDESQYYFLPSDKVRIAENGKGIQYVAYIDGEIVEGTTPDFTDDLNRTGGFLTLEVELGPNQSELDAVKEELESDVGSEVKLAQVPFKDGKVKLMIFGSEGQEENKAVDVSIAGSAKPSLFGRQTAVFSLRLGGKEAQIMWALLKGGSQTQVGVSYDLDFLGVMPAYHLEVTVDFKATEDFWHHHIDADLDLDTGSVKIVSNNDIDLIMRDLVNTGAITIKQVDYTGTGEGNPLGSDDPNGMKLVRELMGPTLFNPTAIPNEDYNVLGSTLPSERGGTTPTPTPTPTPTATTPTPTSSTPTPTSSTPSPTSSTPSPTVTTPSPSVTTPSPSTSTPSPSATTPSPSATPPSNDNQTHTPEPPNTNPPRITNPPTSPTPTPTTPTPTSPTPTTPTPTSPTPTPTSPTPTTPTGEPSTPERVGTKVKINAGYSLKHRSISQQIKRTYVFDKAEAKVHSYYPSGALSLEGTDFDAEKQVMLVRLGDGPFKEIEIEIRSALDFEAFNIREAIVHIQYGFAETEGDKSKPKHVTSIMVNPTEPRKFINFFVDDFGTLTFDYYVEFIHKPNSIIGSHETKIRSRLFENVTERDIAVNIDDHSPLIPIEIQPGHIIFSDEAVQSAQVFVAPTKEGNGKTVIFKEGQFDMQKFLIFPEEEDEYVYFKREKFFFKEDSIEEEYEDLKDSQVLVNRPETRVLDIAPILVNTGNLISKAIVKIKYENGDGDELMRSIVLTPNDADSATKSFSIIVEEEDPRIWNATTQFILTNGDIVEGVEQTYRIEQPPISLEECGLKVLKVSTILGAETFAQDIAAVQVQIFESEPADGANPIETIILRQGSEEQTLVLDGVGLDDALSAVVNVFKKDNTEEVLNFIVPSGSNELLLRIFN